MGWKERERPDPAGPKRSLYFILNAIGSHQRVLNREVIQPVYSLK